MTVLNILSLILSTAALGWGAWNRARARDLEARHDRLQRAHYRLATQLRERHEQVEQELRALRAAQRGAGGAPFVPSMRVIEAVELDPRAGSVLAGFHIGGCDGCAVEPTTTIEEAALASGQPTEQVVAALNALVERGEREVQQLMERRPNVELDL